MLSLAASTLSLPGWALGGHARERRVFVPRKRSLLLGALRDEPTVEHATVPSDEALMARFIAGDATAFEQLFDRLAPLLRGFVLRMVRDRATADDLVQTTFLSLVRGRGRYEQGRSVRSWACAIAANATRDHLRQRSRRPEVSSDVVDFEAESGSVGGDPLLRRRIDAALGELPPAQREVVVMHRVLGLGFPEIAEALGIGLSSAKVRAHRGEQRLRELLGELWEVE